MKANASVECQCKANPDGPGTEGAHEFRVYLGPGPPGFFGLSPI